LFGWTDLRGVAARAWVARDNREIVVSINTGFLAMAQYGGRAVIPVSDVCRDDFSHLTPETLLRKVSAGEIAIPLVRMESSQKAAKGVLIRDQADWIVCVRIAPFADDHPTRRRHDAPTSVPGAIVSPSIGSSVVNLSTARTISLV
jgi:hypothetical protein